MKGVNWVEITVSAPADWVARNGTGPFRGRTPAHAESSAMVYLEYPVFFSDISSRYVLATIRDKAQSLTESGSGAVLACNLLPIPAQVIEEEHPANGLQLALDFDKAWKGESLIGSLWLFSETNIKAFLTEWFEINHERIVALSPMSQLVLSEGRGPNFVDLGASDPEGEILRAARVLVWPTGMCDVEFIDTNVSNDVVVSHFDLITRPDELFGVLEGVLEKLRPAS